MGFLQSFLTMGTCACSRTVSYSYELDRVAFITWKDQVIRYGPVNRLDKNCIVLGFVLTPTMIEGKRVFRYLEIEFACSREKIITEIRHQLDGVIMTSKMFMPAESMQRFILPQHRVTSHPDDPFWSSQTSSAKEHRRRVTGLAGLPFLSRQQLLS